ncbi:hypothetical protein F52700_919 [Fusarium sp. NRRL 52700]|nr:hypothetical protein F52700_919 [Fusarium sp. NRRL 52700]
MAGHEVDCIVRHRVNRQENTIDLFIQWSDDSPRSWEPEEFLQRIDSEALYTYWEDRGGREEVTGLEEHHVFKVKAKGWNKGKLFYDCQWVGYPPEENTWEPASKIMRIAPAAVADWEAREVIRQARVAARRAAAAATSQQDADGDTVMANA